MKDGRILIIYTGGTIGMTKMGTNDSGLVNKMEIIENIIRKLSLHDNDKIVFTDKIIDSSQLDFEMFNNVASIIKDEYFNYMGFLIIGGTDTMAYLQSLLKWHISGLNKPVLLTGAIKSYDADNSEGILNIKYSLKKIIDYKDIGVVGICMNQKVHLYPTSKVDSISPDPYREIKNSNLDLIRKKISVINKDFEFTFVKNIKIEIIYTNPFMFIPETDDLADGLILFLYGQGTIKEDYKCMERIKKYNNNKKPIIIISQCMNNKLDINEYLAGKYLSGINLINGKGSSLEEAIGCLTYLIKNNILLC